MTPLFPNPDHYKFNLIAMTSPEAKRLWRRAIKEYFDNTCIYCGITHDINDLTLDHVLPRSRGGKNTWTNLVAACKKCNQRKGNKTPSESDMRPIRKPVKPKVTVLKNIEKTQINPKWKNYLWNFI